MHASAEFVVLLDEDGTPIGTTEKATVHTLDTPLHLAFSCHVFNATGQLLVTRRALNKLTWPGVWTNSFCGHPGPGEAMTEAVARRARRELGITLDSVEIALPDFGYRAVDASGIVEYEICPVFIAVTSDIPQPADDEVAEFEWVDARALLESLKRSPWAFSPWLTLQLPALDAV
ncbi:MAG: isopentenyl-diphosphate Delta-isomerase, partial [Actinomycetales bacterium]|nr:isopentenyl-diphosphate Delta-isomerase [Actinomycetales bacterium]